MTNQNKPRICEVLGVEVGERFELGSLGLALLVGDDGMIYREYPNGKIKEVELNVNCLVLAINNDLIIRKPRFTEEEKIALGYICRCFSVQKDDELARNDDNVLAIMRGDEVVICLPRKLFPSIRHGQIVKLDEIIEGH